MLSVVVPIYNVELYLRECLQSLYQLSSISAEFILVNDGSTDRSVDIASDFLKKDQRFRLIHTNRVGPGEARNAGVNASNGKYLGFLDSDDIIVSDQYADALNYLRESGSDFITCGFDRMRKGRFQSSTLSRGHDQNRRGIKLEEEPDLIYASVLWNKIFRRDFFISNCHPIPRGIFEDFLPSLKAFSTSDKIDVFSNTVIHWRSRETKDSLTQQRFEKDSVRHRISAIRSCLTFLETRPRKHMEIFRSKLIDHDIRTIIDSLDNAQDEELNESAKDIIEIILKDFPINDAPQKLRKNIRSAELFIKGRHTDDADLIPVHAFRMNDRPRKSTSVSSRNTIKLKELGSDNLDISEFSTLHIHHFDDERGEVFWCSPPPSSPIMEEPFYYQALRKYARIGYAMPFDRIGHWQHPVESRPVIVASIGRCGSTLFSRITSALGLATWSEPDTFTNLSQSKVLPADRPLYHGLLRLALNVLADTPAARVHGQFCIKLRSQATYLLEDIASHHAAPVNFFLVREPVSWAKSFHRLWGFSAPYLASQLVRQVRYVSQARLRGLRIEVLDYAQMVSDPMKCVRDICSAVGLPMLPEETVRAIYSEDSQRGTRISRESGRDVPESFVAAFRQELEERAPELLVKSPLEWFPSAHT